jgi:hypothetical protein
VNADDPLIGLISNAFGHDPRLVIVPKQVNARATASEPTERPVFAVACWPSTWTDPFWLEFFDHMAIPTILFDPVILRRLSRRLNHVGDIGELHVAVATWSLAVSHGLAHRLAARTSGGEELLDPFKLG